MKVLHVLNSRIYSGAEKVACQIIRDFQQDGLEMVYCSPESEIVRQMVTAQNIPCIGIPELTPGELKKVIQAQKPDLIHAHDMRAGFVSALCCGKIPLLSHIHNNAYNARGLTPKSIAYILAGMKAKHILWVSTSSYEGYFFHKLFAKKSSVLYNIIDAGAVYEKRDSDANSYDFDMIYVGRLTYQKDPQRLMRLCARLKADKPDLRAAVVGTGELEGEVKALCAELDLTRNVSFLGFQPNPMKMVADSRAMILTSRWEGTPMCALEAMALGVPVVSTPSDGMKDLIDTGINGCLAETDEELAQSLLKIFRDESHRESLSKAALEKFQTINDAAGYKKAIAQQYFR